VTHATVINNPINTGRKSCTLFIRLPWQESAYFTGTCGVLQRRFFNAKVCPAIAAVPRSSA
jgi:hypothetical protein